MCNENAFILKDLKVKILWEHHKVWKKISPFFDVSSVMSKQVANVANV